MKNPLNIYCDESGYTGGDLLEKNQPYFVYSAVNFTTEELDQIRNYIYVNYNVQNKEIKGRLLVNNLRGQEIIRCLFRKYSKKIRIVYHDKKYALASKIVEYGIEPYLKSNYHFYESKLNNFISSGLYALFITKNDAAEKIFKDFLLILRGKIKFEKSLMSNFNKDNPLFDWLIDIVTKKPSIVLDEIQVDDGKVDKWILDLTMTSLFGLLTEWAKDGNELLVVCDNSKVFIDNPNFEEINRMGRKGNRIKILGTPIGFRLKGNIIIDDSKKNIGLQIADLFSSTVYYCLNNLECEFSKYILRIVYRNSVCRPASFCVLPQILSHKKEFFEKKEYYYRLMNLIYLDVMKRF